MFSFPLCESIMEVFPIVLFFPRSISFNNYTRVGGLLLCLRCCLAFFTLPLRYHSHIPEQSVALAGKLCGSLSSLSFPLVTIFVSYTDCRPFVSLSECIPEQSMALTGKLCNCLPSLLSTICNYFCELYLIVVHLHHSLRLL